jgi:DNA-binding response OmpR family regulator
MTTLLIVEDNPEMVKLYELIFTTYETYILQDIPETLAFLERCVPDVVITDFQLPSGSGLEILEHLRSREATAHVPVLGVSIDDSVKYDAKQRGLNAFLIKPIEIRELHDTVEYLLTGVKKQPVWTIPQQSQETPVMAYEPPVRIEAESTPPIEVEADVTRRHTQIHPMPAADEIPANRNPLGHLISKFRRN